MIATVRSAVCIGVNAFPIDIEVDVGPGLPQFTVVGLPDQSLKECRERVRSAIKNSGFPFPPDKIIINLAPADLKKEGPAFDLPIALGILAASGILSQAAIDPFIFFGELALDGSLRPVKGAIAMTSGLGKNRPFVCPSANVDEACLEKEAVVYGVSNLAEAAGFLKKETVLQRSTGSIPVELRPKTLPDFADVKGQAFAKRALEIAVSGGHNVLLIGPPGSGKSMLSQRIPSILPPLGFEEKIELTKIYSIAGMMEKTALIQERPFRSPHHSISPPALVGGGSIPKPGEISLAHCGVLFLDEFPEFRKDVIESLRAPMEDGRIMVSRTRIQLDFPCRFMLIAAMNPCPCGYLGHPKRPCRCLSPQIRRYQSKVSGPILDRIDLHVEVPVLPFEALSSDIHAENSASILKRVLKCRAVQNERYGSERRLNVSMKAREMREFTKLDSPARRLMESAVKEMGFSARAYYKILKIARTIADLAEEKSVSSGHIAEAIQYRSLDRQWV